MYNKIFFTIPLCFQNIAPPSVSILKASSFIRLFLIREKYPLKLFDNLSQNLIDK